MRVPAQSESKQFASIRTCKKKKSRDSTQNEDRNGATNIKEKGKITGNEGVAMAGRDCCDFDRAERKMFFQDMR